MTDYLRIEFISERRSTLENRTADVNNNGDKESITRVNFQPLTKPTQKLS